MSLSVSATSKNCVVMSIWYPFPASNMPVSGSAMVLLMMLAILTNSSAFSLSPTCKEAKLQARIKPTALCLAIDKENSIEFLLDLLHYLYNYYMVCVLLFHAYHMTHYVTSCDVVLWLPTMWLWHLWCDTFPHSLLCSKSKIKEKKRNINNDLAVLSSHDTTPLLIFLIPRNFLQLVVWINHVAHFIFVFFCLFS